VQRGSGKASPDAIKARRPRDVQPAAPRRALCIDVRDRVTRSWERSTGMNGRSKGDNESGQRWKTMAEGGSEENWSAQTENGEISRRGFPEIRSRCRIRREDPPPPARIFFKGTRKPSGKFPYPYLALYGQLPCTN